MLVASTAMLRPIVGLLPLEPRSLHLYWDAPGYAATALSIHARPGVVLSGLESSGSRYLDHLAPEATYRAELRCGGQVIARSEPVALPRSGAEPAAAVVPPVAPASESHHR